MAQTGCMCPGCFAVWIWSGTEVAGNWELLSNIDSWRYNPNVTQSTPKRTSSTHGIARRFCSDLVTYDLEVVTTLCASDWLFCDILVDEQVLSAGITTWLFTSWHCDYTDNPAFDQLEPGLSATVLNAAINAAPPTIPAHTEPGAYVYGQIQPPGFGGDNTTNDPTTASFNVTIYNGPFLPSCSEGGGEGIVEDPPAVP